MFLCALDMYGEIERATDGMVAVGCSNLNHLPAQWSIELILACFCQMAIDLSLYIWSTWSSFLQVLFCAVLCVYADGGWLAGWLAGCSFHSICTLHTLILLHLIWNVLGSLLAWSARSYGNEFIHFEFPLVINKLPTYLPTNLWCIMCSTQPSDWLAAQNGRG